MFELGAKVSRELEAAHKYASDASNILALSSDAPKDRIVYLRKVFEKMNKDVEVQKEMARVTSIWSPF